MLRYRKCFDSSRRRQYLSLWTITITAALIFLLYVAKVDSRDTVTPRPNDDNKVVEVLNAVPDSVEETRKKPTKRDKTNQEPQVASLLADFDHDGHVGHREIQQIKDKLHEHLDPDDSGGLDLSELKKRAQTDQDVAAALTKLDSDRDAVISWKELDARWESVGAEMTVNEVADWVAYAVQLPQYSETFRENSISGYTFPLLMASDGAKLEEIGVQSDLHRHQLAMFMQMKYLGMGRKPKAVASSVCTAESTTTNDKVLIQVAWVPAENTPQRYQLQRRRPGESTWVQVFIGSDTEFLDVVDPDQHVVYRLTTWNSYGRSAHTFIHCTHALEIPSASSTKASLSPPLSSADKSLPPVRSSPPQRKPSQQVDVEMDHTEEMEPDEDVQRGRSVWGLLKVYFWWLDDAIVILLVVMLPIRGIIYGDADSLLRLLRRLPPNMPTRVTVEVEPSKMRAESAAARVSWEKPLDNGVPIVCYTVRWTRTKTEEVKWMKLLTVPLPTTVIVEKLHHGETYKFVVEATNQFGLVASSSRSTYMVPVPELKGKLRPRHLPTAQSRAVRNQCHVCHDPRYTKKVPFIATLDRRILHFCCFCDKEFCHYHKGDVYHSKAVSCPIVDGRCVCISCKDNNNRLQRTVTY